MGGGDGGSRTTPSSLAPQCFSLTTPPSLIHLQVALGEEWEQEMGAAERERVHQQCWMLQAFCNR